MKTKTKQTVEAAVPKRESERDLNPIPLFKPQPPPHAAVVEGKLELSLRTMELEQELKDIPKTTVELHQIILQMRQRRYEATYHGILAYLKLLQEDSKFYRKFGCGTIVEYHLTYGIGGGSAMAKLIVLVKLFEFNTFVLVGDRLLNEMVSKLIAVQPSAAARKHDIRLIFERYCERYERFDREAFRHTVRSYVNEQYPPPPATTASMRVGRRGQEIRATARSDGKIVALSPKDSGGRKLGQSVCPGCERRDRDLGEHEKLSAAYERYVRQLVRIITDVLKGEHLLTHIDVPPEIRAYRKLHSLPVRP